MAREGNAALDDPHASPLGAARGLPAAPANAVDERGEPRFGAFQGHLKDVSWERLAGRFGRGFLWKMLHAKRWHYVSIAGPKVALAAVVVDLGWAASAFLYVFDRETKALLYDQSFMGLQKVTHRVSTLPGEAGRTIFVGLGASLRLERPAGSPIWQLQAEGPGGLLLDASLDASSAPPTLLAIASIEGGVANATHKTVGLPARGEVRVGGRRFDLGGHHGSLDHTMGLLARETSWRWASASSGRIGLNLVEGFNGPVENALWVDGRLYPAGAATFEFDKNDHLKPWRIRTSTGAIDLTFTPEGARREDKQLYIAQSWYVQPIGVFSGTVRPPGGPPVQVTDLVGVTEDHVAKW